MNNIFRVSTLCKYQSPRKGSTTNDKEKSRENGKNRIYLLFLNSPRKGSIENDKEGAKENGKHRIYLLILN